MLLLFRQGACIQANMLHTIIIQQITGIESLPPGVIGLTANIRVFMSLELLANRLFGPLIGSALIRGNLLSVPYSSYVILVFCGYAVNNIEDVSTKQFHRDAVEEYVTVGVAHNRHVLSLNDIHSDTRLLQQFEGTCELV